MLTTRLHKERRAGRRAGLLHHSLQNILGGQTARVFYITKLPVNMGKSLGTKFSGKGPGLQKKTKLQRKYLTDSKVSAVKRGNMSDLDFGMRPGMPFCPLLFLVCLLVKCPLGRSQVWNKRRSFQRRSKIRVIGQGQCAPTARTRVSIFCLLAHVPRLPQTGPGWRASYAPGDRERLLLACLTYDGLIERAGLKGGRSAAARVHDESAGPGIFVLCECDDPSRARRIEVRAAGAHHSKLKWKTVYFPSRIADPTHLARSTRARCKGA